MGLNVSSGKWRPLCLGLNVLIFRMTEYLKKPYLAVSIFHEVWWEDVLPFSE